MLRLETSTAGPLGIALRPLSGGDEAACEPGGLAAARTLVARLLAPSSEDELGADELDSVSVSDFDRILAQLHRSLYGELLECRICCTSCEEPMEFAVALDALLAPKGDPPQRDAVAGWFVLQEGLRFRLPRLGEALAGPSRAEVTSSCAEGPWQVDDLDRAMEAAGPQGADVVQTSCPECGAAQQARLDLAEYLMRMLVRESEFLAREVHVLARAYHWSFGEIMGLPREGRRAFVRLLDAEATAVHRARRRIA